MIPQRNLCVARNWRDFAVVCTSIWTQTPSLKCQKTSAVAKIASNLWNSHPLPNQPQSPRLWDAAASIRDQIFRRQLCLVLSSKSERFRLHLFCIEEKKVIRPLNSKIKAVATVQSRAQWTDIVHLRANPVLWIVAMVLCYLQSRAKVIPFPGTQMLNKWFTIR